MDGREEQIKMDVGMDSCLFCGHNHQTITNPAIQGTVRQKFEHKKKRKSVI
jgi:hypothetical protein